MSEFKLLAIIPLKGCGLKFTKNLKIGKNYSFYQDYQITLDKNKSTVLSVVKAQEKDALNLYSKPNEIKISVSAIVGENGSGKSNLFELFYYFIYFIGTNSEKKNKRNETIIETSEKRIGYELNEIIELINSWRINKPDNEERNILLARIISRYHINIYEKGEKKSVDQFIYEKLKEKKNQIKKRIVSARKLEQNIKNRLNVSVLFETDQIYCAEIVKGNFSLSVFKNGIKVRLKGLRSFDLEDFFYSVSVNYSHHSLNSNSLGEWINSLFHKNDGYQTPLVINPMRNNGNFNINDESKLLKERLIGNITYNLYKTPHYKLLNKYRFNKFIFSHKLNTGGETVGIRPFDDSRSYYANDPIGKILHHEDVPEHKNDRIVERAIAYLDKKVFRIPEEYPFLFKSEITRNNYKELVKFVIKDSTHITKKIRQTIHFLKNYAKTEELENLWKPDHLGRIELSTQEMIQWLDSFKDMFALSEKDGTKLSPYYFSLFALPGFMNVDFEITDTEKGKTFRLSELSSGEQQMILNLSSITYHLNNIQSIHEEDEKRVKYKYVNILLDEIELYYHPNSQREMVNEILNSIKELPLMEKGIQAVNIIFSTHSPFILSDIPSINILRLKEGKPEPICEQTFGANINDLLADSFFMESAIGKFAEDEILRVIDDIKNKQLSEKDNSIIKMIGDSFLKISIEQFKKEHND